MGYSLYHRLDFALTQKHKIMLVITIKEGSKSVRIQFGAGFNKPTRVRPYTRVRNGKVEHVKGYIRQSWTSEE